MGSYEDLFVPLLGGFDHRLGEHRQGPGVQGGFRLVDQQEREAVAPFREESSQ